MAALVSHIPERGGQNIRYYGYYSNATRGRLKKEEDEPQYHIIEDESPRSLNRSRPRLIQKIYEVAKKILDYLGIYEFKRKRPPPKIESTPNEFDEYIRDDYIDCDHVC